MEILIVILILVNIAGTVYFNKDKLKRKTAEELKIIEDKKKNYAEEKADRERVESARKAFANLTNFNSYKKKDT